MSNNRFFAFFGENRASVAMDIRPINEAEAELTFALAFCGERDDFRKDIARNILNGRLDAAQDPEHNKPVRLVFNTIYRGNHPKRDVMNRIMDELRSLPKSRPHGEVATVLDLVQEDLEQTALKGFHETAHLR
jgi:hypothetical protein